MIVSSPMAISFTLKFTHGLGGACPLYRKCVTHDGGPVSTQPPSPTVHDSGFVGFFGFGVASEVAEVAPVAVLR